MSGRIGRPDHGLLLGLGDDDHPQYFDQARLDAWWTTTEAGLSTDHGDLDGLADDDHTQYLLINGSRAMTGDLDMNDHWVDNALGLRFASTRTLHIYDPVSAKYRVVMRSSDYAGNSNDILVNDGAGGLILQWDDSASRWFMPKPLEITPPGTIAGDWANYLQAGIVIGNSDSGVGIDINEITFGGMTAYINAPDGPMYLRASTYVIQNAAGDGTIMNVSESAINFYATTVYAQSGNLGRYDGTLYNYMGLVDSTFARFYTNSNNFYFNAPVRGNGGFLPYVDGSDSLGSDTLSFNRVYAYNIYDETGSIRWDLNGILTMAPAGVISHDNPGTNGGTIAMGWASDWYRFRLGSNSYPQGVMVAAYENPVIWLRRDGNVRVVNGATLQVSGTLYQGNGSWGCYYETDEPSSGIDSISTTYSSSARYKTNIGDATINPRAVLDAKLREWDWDEDVYEMVHGIRPKAPLSGRAMGLVAEEVHAVEPRLVALNANGEPERILDGKPLLDAILAALQHLDTRLAILEAA